MALGFSGGSRILPIPAVSAGVSAAARRLERRRRALPEGLARLEAAADCSWLRELQAEGAEEAEEAEDNRQQLGLDLGQMFLSFSWLMFFFWGGALGICVASNSCKGLLLLLSGGG